MTVELAPPPLDPAPHSNHAVRGKRLGLGLLTVYGSGALVQDTAAYLLSYLLLFYLTVVCGMAASDCHLHRKLTSPA